MQVHSEPVEVLDGLLEWGVKRSLYEYVSTMSGEIATTGPAVIAPNLHFNFPLVEQRRTDGVGGGITLKFAGGIRFRAHQGLMEIAFDDPWVEMDSVGYRLSAVFGGFSERSVLADLAHVEPELRDRESRWDGVPTQLARTGAILFEPPPRGPLPGRGADDGAPATRP